MPLGSTPTYDIPRRIWPEYLDGLTRLYTGWSCSVEVMSLDLGDQPVIEHQQLRSILWEPHGEGVRAITIEAGDPTDPRRHRVSHPVSVREANTHPGQEAAIQIESDDGLVTIIRVRRRPALPQGRGTKRAPRVRRWGALGALAGVVGIGAAAVLISRRQR